MRRILWLLLLIGLFVPEVRAQVSFDRSVQSAIEVYESVPADIRRPAPQLYVMADPADPAGQSVMFFSQNVPHGGVPPGTPLTACGNITVSGLYYLANDVVSTGTCFNVQANNVSVNLNGQTVTYGNSTTSKIVVGFLGINCGETMWTNGSMDTTTGQCSNLVSGVTPFQNFEVYAGNIKQGAGTLPEDSDSIMMDSWLNGNGYLQSGPSVHEVNFTWTAGNSFAVSTNYGGEPVAGGAILHDNVFNNGKTGPVCAMVSCREGLEGASAIIGHAESTTTPAQAYNNQIYGGTQGGIMIDAPGSSFTNNIPIDAGNCTNEYSNDFAIFAWGPGQIVTGNHIGSNPPAPCQYQRGVSIDLTEYSGEGAAYTVSDNVIYVIASTLNAEYSGCPLGGQYGIQSDDGGGPANINTNISWGFSYDCAGTGLRLTEIGAGIVTQGNSFAGVLEPGAPLTPSDEFPTTAVYVDGGSSFPPSVLIGDSFTGDFSAITVDYNGSGPLYFDQCTLDSGSNPTGFVTLAYWNGGDTSVQTYLIDCTYDGLAVPTLTDMHVGNGSPYQLEQYFIEWGYSIHAVGGVSGNPISGATLTVTASSAAGSGTECTATTNSSGDAYCIFGYTPPSTITNSSLIQFDMKNSTTVAQINTNHNPHQVVVSKSGCTTNTSSLTITGTINLATITLGGC